MVLAWAGMDIHSLMLSIQHFFLPTIALPTLQGTLKDGFRDTVLACDMPESCKFPSLGSQETDMFKVSNSDTAPTAWIMFCALIDRANT